MIYKNSFNLNLNFRVFFRVKVIRPRMDDRGKEGEGLERGKKAEEKRLRDRVAFPIENRGKPTSAHLKATIFV